jgi:putative transposase
VLEEAFRKRKRKRGIGAVGKSWRLDETYIKIGGNDRYWYRAVDKQSNTVEFLADRQTRWSCGTAVLHTRRQEQPRSQDRQHRQERSEQGRDRGLQCQARHHSRDSQCKYLNNIVEQDHRAVAHPGAKHKCRTKSFERIDSTRYSTPQPEISTSPANGKRAANE